MLKFVHIRKLLFIIIIMVVENSFCKTDLTIVGRILFSDGIGRHAIEIMDMLHDRLNINFKKICNGMLCVNFKDVPFSVQKIVKNNNDEIGTVSLFVDVLARELVSHIPPSRIKIAFSVFETTRIPYDWVSKLNSHFDAVIVPDKFLVNVYKNSGVKIPIFVIPLNLFLDKFLKVKPKQVDKENFKFGMSAEFYARKNHALLLEAFRQEFGHNKNVTLYLHGRGGSQSIYKRLLLKKNHFLLKNVDIIYKRLSELEYVSFISSLDCYVFVSAGEGFSITPREALACGIPCILSNNSAHNTICKTGFVRSVPCPVAQLASLVHSRATPGYYYSPTIPDIRHALREVYENYGVWLRKARAGKEWVTRYLAPNLKKLYLSIIKPQKVILGKKNKVTDEYLMTSSRELYNKYKSIV